LNVSTCKQVDNLNTSTASTASRQMEKQCKVKVVVNSKIKQTACALRISPDNGVINLKFMIKNTNELHSLVEYLRDTLRPSYCWVIEWNWTNVPAQIKNDESFRAKILEMFSNVKILRFDNFPKLAEEGPSLFSYVAPPLRGRQLAPTLIQHSRLPEQAPVVQPGPSAISLPEPRPTAPPELDMLASQLAAHIQLYRAAPDLTGLTHNLKKKAKAINYIRSALARPTLSEEFALIIAEKTNAQLATLKEGI
jgi:hypothetical protein